jgi:hypothetical protein
MKFLPFKILIVFILLPPVCYILSIQYLENHLSRKYLNAIEEIYIGDTGPLFAGSALLDQVINDNIDAYLRNETLIKWGTIVNVTVSGENGQIVYPAYAKSHENTTTESDPLPIAAENYRMLQEGLNVKVNVTLPHNTLISNLILGGYSFLFLLGLYFYYRTGARKFMMAQRRQRENIHRLVATEKSQSQKLSILTQNREEMAGEIERTRHQLEDTKSKASKNEDNFIEEIVNLEKKISKNIAVQGELKKNIEKLQKEIGSFQPDKRPDTTKARKEREKIKKKFSVLYKNIIVHDRAIDGFMTLSDEMQIKGEEIIHQMNSDSQQIQVKRKVFNKKSRATVLEVLFAYKGRLYFRNIKGKIEILSIGTKNSQAGDLAFLNHL